MIHSGGDLEKILAVSPGANIHSVQKGAYFLVNQSFFLAPLKRTNTRIHQQRRVARYRCLHLCGRFFDTFKGTFPGRVSLAAIARMITVLEWETHPVPWEIIIGSPHVRKHTQSPHELRYRHYQEKSN